MYLKCIEVQGFKSFANKIVFEFHNGITGIVGPNGSGKSNVADAVRWVLGEQSAKQLRGANMQDVIFSGTENRKPLGFASVAITLDNSDHKLPLEYEEVTVARKVYRSGESEYILNGTACRLKDVQELFYDTGIGKEGYSLIGQGQIDKILSGKPEERRELFDEAAGIVKFKRRKKAALKNLENEQQNLVRISDILFELEKQVGPLAKQSEKARIYLKAKEELKTYDVNMFLLRYERTKEQQKELDEKLDIAGSDLDETKNQYENTKNEYSRIEQDMQAVEEKMEECRTKRNNSMVSKQKYEGDIRLFQEQISSIKERENSLAQQKDALQLEITKRMQEKGHLEDEQKELLEQISVIKSRESESEDEITKVSDQIHALSDSIEAAKNEIIELLNKKALIQSNQQRYDTMLEQVQIRKAGLSKRLLENKSSETELSNNISEYEEALKNVCAKLSDLEENKKTLEAKYTQGMEQSRHYAEQLTKLQNDFHRKKSNLDFLINTTERYEGYGNAPRRVMEQKEKNPGVIGVVADIIMTEKKYETAIETALGASIQNIVTDNEQTAKEMISMLKKNHYGRATFLPLTSMNSKSGLNDHAVLKETGVLGVASTLVQAEKRFDGIMSFLLGRTIVMDTMDHAIETARKYHHSIRIVTLEGELLNVGGSMSGGAYKNSSNLLGRRREIEELQQETAKIKEEIATINKASGNNNEFVKEIQVQLDKLQDEMQKEFLVQNTARMNLNQANEKKEEFMQGYGLLKNESSEIELQIQEINFQKKHVSEEIVAAEAKTADLNSQIEEQQLQIQIIKQKRTDMSQQHSSQQIEHAGLFQKNDNITENISRLSNEIEHYTNNMQELDVRRQSEESECKEKEEQILELKNNFEKASSDFDSSEVQIKDFAEQKEILARNNKEFLAKREELMERMNSLDKESYRLNNQKEKLDEQIEDSINYMWEEYELTYSTALALRREDLNQPAEIKKVIQELRNDIRKLGDVNVNAIEEYKTVSERYEFLNTQRNDLIEAEENLKSIIAELDEGMRKQFTEKFAQIRVEFDKAFKELFGGGKGTLELDEDADLLEAGIRIISQPPGKKLGNMMQLSGGEKALTAIALLFAIQNLKPSPFCLLDEIEAALDDSNVSRYADYLHKLTKNTQFIIITHRRGTMAAADRLYGITMQEKGVSTLVSVNLIEEELDK